jgi:plasmid stability protein
VSLPPDLAEYLERRATEHGVALSAELADIVRRDRTSVDQARLDEALALDAEDNRRLARAAEPSVRALLRDVEW